MKTPVLFEGGIFSKLKGGGICRIYTEIIPHIVEKSSEAVFLIHLPLACPRPFPPSQSIQYWQEPRSGKYGWRRWIKEQVARSNKPKIFQSTYYESPPWSGMSTVTTAYDFVDCRLPLLGPNGQLFIDRQRKALKESEVVIAISAATKSDAVHFSGIHPDKVKVIPLAASDLFANPIKDCDETIARKFANGQKYWLYVGSRLPYKNFATMLRAFIQIAKQTEEDLLVIGGGTGLESWQLDLLVHARLEDRVHVHPAVSDIELRQAYAGASAFVFPSLAEGFGIPILEAMATGAPVILSDIPVFHEVSGEAAMFFDPHSQEALAHCLLNVQRKSEVLISAGFENARKYDWSKTSCEFAAVYASLA